jgi:hypothetical protein
LNHVVRELPVKAAHIIDWDVFIDCAEAIERNAGILIMPWMPHLQNRPGTRNLSELCGQQPALERMRKAGRLVWYNLSSAQSFRPGSPVVSATYFSAEAALSILAMAGIKTVRSLGIDGGAAYSNRFTDLERRTLLSNRQPSFDAQFEGIAATILQTGVDYAPLDIESPMRIFVATTETQMLSFKVLEYSIRKHASLSVNVVPIHTSGVSIAMSHNDSNRLQTSSLFQHFLIPQLAGFRGRAIYLGSDMQVFRDIRELWTYPMGEAPVLTVQPSDTTRQPQFSVMLLDCARLDWKIDRIVAQLDEGQLSYDDLMRQFKVAPSVSASIEPVWDSLEQYRYGETALLHYTDTGKLPWVSVRNPLGYLWVNCLIEAVDNGFLTLDYIKEHVEKGFVRPSLLRQVERRIIDSLPFGEWTTTIDAAFLAPLQGIVKWRSRPWSYPGLYLKALLRNFSQRLRYPRLKRMLNRLLVR